MATVHRIWDFRGDQAAVVWFRKQPDGSTLVVRRLVDQGLPLVHYASFVLAASIDLGSVDYVRSDAHVKNLNGESLFQALQRFGLNPEVLPADAWRSLTPFAVAA